MCVCWTRSLLSAIASQEVDQSGKRPVDTVAAGVVVACVVVVVVAGVVAVDTAVAGGLGVASRPAAGLMVCSVRAVVLGAVDRGIRDRSIS